MKKVKLQYGTTGLEVSIDAPNVTVVEPRYVPGLPDEAGAFRDAVRAPIGTKPLKELISSTDKVAVVISDITRPLPTDRLLLSDMNRNFYLGKRELNAAVPYDLADLAAVQSFRAGGETPPPDPKDPAVKPPSNENFDSLLDLKVYYDRKPVELTTPDGRSV